MSNMNDKQHATTLMNNAFDAALTNSNLLERLADIASGKKSERIPGGDLDNLVWYGLFSREMIEAISAFGIALRLGSSRVAMNLIDRIETLSYDHARSDPKGEGVDHSEMTGVARKAAIERLSKYFGQPVDEYKSLRSSLAFEFGMPDKERDIESIIRESATSGVPVASWKQDIKKLFDEYMIVYTDATHGMMCRVYELIFPVDSPETEHIGSRLIASRTSPRSDSLHEDDRAVYVMQNLDMELEQMLIQITDESWLSKKHDILKANEKK